jgi:hypothetical protein
MLEDSSTQVKHQRESLEPTRVEFLSVCRPTTMLQVSPNNVGLGRNVYPVEEFFKSAKHASLVIEGVNYNVNVLWCLFENLNQFFLSL